MHLPECQVDLAFRIGVKRADGEPALLCEEHCVLDVRSWDSDFKFRTAINCVLDVLAGSGVITQIL